MRAKKLPERTGPRGAKDAIRFRERLVALSKRAARIRAGGHRLVVRRKAFAFPGADPTTWFDEQHFVAVDQSAAKWRGEYEIVPRRSSAVFIGIFASKMVLGFRSWVLGFRIWVLG